MKKIITLALAIVLCASALFAFAGCSEKNENELVMATNASFPPYEYKEGNKIVGIDAEIADAIAKKLGKTLVIKDVDFGSILGGVETGKFDFGMAGMTVTEDRKKQVNFTTSYATGVQVVIVKEGSAITKLEDLDGATYKIGVQQDTTGDIYASDTPEKGGYGEDRVVRYKTGNDAVAALVAGKVDCVIIDNEPAKSYVAANEGLKILDTEYTVEDYAIAIKKENTELLDQINKALADLKADGTLDDIIEKYIPSK